MKSEEFNNPTCDTITDTTKFISSLDLTPILATIEEFYSEPWQHRHPPEAVLRLLVLYKLKRCRFLKEL